MLSPWSRRRAGRSLGARGGWWTCWCGTCPPPRLPPPPRLSAATQVRGGAVMAAQLDALLCLLLGRWVWCWGLRRPAPRLPTWLGGSPLPAPAPGALAPPQAPRTASWWSTCAPATRAAPWSSTSASSSPRTTAAALTPLAASCPAPSSPGTRWVAGWGWWQQALGGTSVACHRQAVVGRQAGRQAEGRNPMPITLMLTSLPLPAGPCLLPACTGADIGRGVHAR